MIYWAQRLENDGNDYVYKSDDNSILKIVESFNEKTDLIYYVSKMLDKEYAKKVIDMKNSRYNVKIYYNKPITKLYIDLTIGVDNIGRESPAFIYFENDDGIDIKELENRIQTVLTEFTEVLHRKIEMKTVRNVNEAFTRLIKSTESRNQYKIFLFIGSAIAAGMFYYFVIKNH